MTHLKASISLWQGVGLLATTLLGTGVFILPGLTVAMANGGALIAWTLLVVLIIPITWVFGRLGMHYPHAGGPAHFVGQAFGERYGQTLGLMFLCLVPIGAAPAIEMTLQFLTALVPMNDSQLWWVELAFVISIFALNWRGVSLSGSLQSALTLSIVLVVVACLIGLVFAPQANSTQSLGLSIAWPTVITAISLGFWSFLGIEALSHYSEEFKHPQRDFGRALNIGVILVGAIYILCTYLVFTLPTPSDTLPMVAVFDQYLGGGGKWIVGLLGVVSGAATVNVYSASTARLAYSLARQGTLPNWWAGLNQHGVPARAMGTLLTVVALTLAASHLLDIHFATLIIWTNGIILFIYTATMLAAMRLLKGKDQRIAQLASVIGLVLMITFMENMLPALVMALVLHGYLTRQSRTKTQSLAP